MNISELERLVELVQGADIGELTLRHNGARVTIRRAPQRSAAEPGDALAILPEGDVNGDFHLDMSTDAEYSGRAAPVEEEVIIIESPRVGTFRHARNPVTLGALVKADQVLGIIEAMKLPNEVTALRAGKVVEVFVEEGQFVEYGQDLYAIQPDS